MNTTLISDAARLASIVDEYRKKGYNVLYHGAYEIAPLHAVSIRQVVISMDRGAGDVFKADSGLLALTRYALNKLEIASGIDWIPQDCVRLDDGSKLHYAAYQASAVIRNLDGTVRRAIESKELDLRDGSAQVSMMKASQLGAARANIAALAESKAKNRVRRSILGLKPGFSPEELKHPFIVLKLIPNPELNPVLMQELSMELARSLYGVSLNVVEHRRPASPVPVPTPEAIDIADADIPDEDEAPEAIITWPAPDLIINPIEEIKALYTKKLGKDRDTSKPALETLTPEQLIELKASLEKLEDAV